MTAKEYLRQLKTLDNVINAKLLEKERIRALATKVTSNLGERVQGGGFGGIENTVIKITELEIQINADIDKLVDLKAEATQIIDSLEDNKYKAILSMYYVSNLTFEQVAENTDMTFRWIHKLHGRALKEFEKKYSSS